MRDPLNTKRTQRQRLVDMLTGNLVRDAALVAAVNAHVTRSAITAVDAATFGYLNDAAGSPRCSIVNGSKNLASTDAPWTVADVGKEIHVQGAGVAGATLVARIVTFSTASAVVLDTAASTTVAESSTSSGGAAIWGLSVDATIDGSPRTAADGSVSQSLSASIRSGSTSRSLASRYSDFVNVKDYGALGNGVTDDSAAIQAAIDVGCATGKAVYFPAAQYVLNSTINIIAQGYSFCIRGDGWTSELRKSANVGAMFRIVNPGAPSYFEGGVIEDINILSDSATDANIGFKLADNAGTGPIVNLRFRNVMINNFIKSVENNCESNEINFNDCWFVSGGYGVYDNYGGADWRFFGCHFQALTNWAIWGSMSSVTIVGCTQQSYRDGAKGFRLNDGRCHVITGCYFEGEPNIGAVAIPPYPADGQSGVIGDGQSIAIQFDGDNRGGLIASNNFDMFYGKAIVVNATDGLTIVGNYFQKCQVGIQMAAAATNVDIGVQSWMPECVVPVSYVNPAVTNQSLPYVEADGTKTVGGPDLGFAARDDYPSLPALAISGTLGAEITPGGDAASAVEVDSVGSWVNYGATLTTLASVNAPYTAPDGTYMLRFSGPNGSKGYLALTTVVGQVYRVTFKAKKESGSPCCVISDAPADTYSTATQRRHQFLSTTRGYELVTMSFVATATTTYLMFVMVGASECFVDSVSVKPITSGAVLSYNGEFTYINGRKVVIGAPDSGGAGYRTFLVEN